MLYHLMIMGDDVTIEKLVSALQNQPFSNAKELCRMIHGRNAAFLRTPINRLLFTNQKIFLKNEPSVGEKAPRWSLKENSNPNEKEFLVNKSICRYCSQRIMEGQEYRHVNSLCTLIFEK